MCLLLCHANNFLSQNVKWDEPQLVAVTPFQQNKILSLRQLGTEKTADLEIELILGQIKSETQVP